MENSSSIMIHRVFAHGFRNHFMETGARECETPAAPPGRCVCYGGAFGGLGVRGGGVG